MKKTGLLMAACLVWSACTNEPRVANNEFLIEGTLENVEDGEILGLWQFDGDVLTRIAQDTIRNGRFSFRDTIVQLGLYSIWSEGDKFSSDVMVWLAPGKSVHISGEGYNACRWIAESDLQEQKDQNQLAEAIRDERTELGPMLTEENKWYQIGDANPGNDSIQQIARNKIDSLRLEENKIQEKIMQKEIEVLKTLPMGKAWMRTYVDKLRVLQYAPGSPYEKDLRALFGRLSEADKQTPEGRIATGYLNLPQPVGIGDEMADGDLYDVEGKVHHLSELKGQYILLDFWSCGCGPCISSIPELKEIAKEYTGELAIVSLSSDTENVWKEALKRYQMKGNQWNELRGTTGLFAAYQVRRIPHYVLISPEGKIQAAWSGYSEGLLKKKIQEQLKKG